ncbi:hypothetical protein VNO77_22068 [Canavalia gladiata]|uniref:Uncharacterized protein n=1 Tax=Canavalia gladiata TaxID=3824 RepID=A0AAN9L2D6_CANGL
MFSTDKEGFTREPEENKVQMVPASGHNLKAKRSLLVEWGEDQLIGKIQVQDGINLYAKAMQFNAMLPLKQEKPRCDVLKDLNSNQFLLLLDPCNSRKRKSLILTKRAGGSQSERKLFFPAQIFKSATQSFENAAKASRDIHEFYQIECSNAPNKDCAEARIVLDAYKCRKDGVESGMEEKVNV